MNLKKVFFGERMPDKEDPEYQELRKKSYDAGRRFGDAIGLPWLGEKIYLVSSRHKKFFFVLLFSFVIFWLCLKTYTFVRAVNRINHNKHTTAVERVDSALEHRYDKKTYHIYKND